MSRGPGRIERVCLNVLEEAEAEQPVIGRTADEIAVVAFVIKDPWAPGGKRFRQTEEERRQRTTALSSVQRALRRLKARGLVYESGLSAGWDPHEGKPWAGRFMSCDDRKLYRMTVTTDTSPASQAKK